MAIPKRKTIPSISPANPSKIFLDSASVAAAKPKPAATAPKPAAAAPKPAAAAPKPAAAAPKSTPIMSPANPSKIFRDSESVAAGNSSAGVVKTVKPNTRPSISPANPSKIFRDSESVAAGDPRTGPPSVGDRITPVNSSKTPVVKKNPAGKKKPAIEDPALPPTDGTGGGTTTPKPAAPKPERGPVPKDWAGIVNHFFPSGGNVYKAGGLVRGGGCAAKGRGRGKIV